MRNTRIGAARLNSQYGDHRTLTNILLYGRKKAMPWRMISMTSWFRSRVKKAPPSAEGLRRADWGNRPGGARASHDNCVQSTARGEIVNGLLYSSLS